jgi:predicted Zn-dependent protease
MNAERLGLSVVVDRGMGSTTTNGLSEELPSVEEALKALASVCIGENMPRTEYSVVQVL